MENDRCVIRVRQNAQSAVYDPGHGRIGGHYFHALCPSVTKIKMRATKDTMCENDDHLLAGAWWVTLKSSDLFCVFLANKVEQ